MTDNPRMFVDEEYETFQRCCVCAFHLGYRKFEIGLCWACLGTSILDMTEGRDLRPARVPIPFTEWWCHDEYIW